MRYFKFIFGVLSGIMAGIGITSAQSDVRTADLMGAEDWFALERELPSLSENMTDRMLLNFAGLMTDYYFNRPDEALIKGDILLQNYQDELGWDNVANVILILADAMRNKGDYGKAYEILDGYINQISQYVDLADYPNHTELREFLSALRDLPLPVVQKPERDVEVPMSAEESGRGKNLFVPVSGNGMAFDFVFDTGAEMTGISRKTAESLDARVVYDSIHIVGAGEGYGQLAVLDDISIGDIVFRNALVVVFPDADEEQPMDFDGILGLDFMRKAGEIRIFPHQSKIVFPLIPTPIPESTGRNILIQNGQPYVEIISGIDRLFFHFDTGNVKGDLHYPWFEAHKEWIIENCEQTEVTGGGFGGIFTRTVYIVPQFNFWIGDRNWTIENMEVYTEPVLMAQHEEDGAFGYSLLHIADEVIINFTDMFLWLK